MTSLLAEIVFLFEESYSKNTKAFLCLFLWLVTVGSISQQTNPGTYFSTLSLQLLTESRVHLVNITEDIQQP